MSTVRGAVGLAALAVSMCITARASSAQEPSRSPSVPPPYVPPAYVPPAYLGAPAPPVAPAPSTPRRRWYGWQTLAVDGAALGLFVVAAQDGREPVVSIGVGTGIATILLGAPVVHWAHGRVGVGFLSLGLRVAFPALAGYLLSSEPCLGGSECSLDVVLGLGLLATPIVVDAAVLAREPEIHVAGLTLTPSLALGRGPHGPKPMAAFSGSF